MLRNTLGGWTVEPQERLPEEVAKGFSQVMGNFFGTGYKPLLYCGLQIVNGVNHLLICEGKPAIRERKTTLAEIILNEAPRTGSFSLVGITPIIDATTADGGWVAEPGALPERVATGFGGVKSHLLGAKYEPLLYCGTQVVFGINYMIICKQTTMTSPAEVHVVKVVLNETPPEAGKAIGEFSLLQIDRII